MRSKTTRIALVVLLHESIQRTFAGQTLAEAEIEPLDLSRRARADLVAVLNTLTDGELPDLPEEPAHE